MKMKILFWLLAIVSLPLGCFMSIVAWFAGGLGLAGTTIGEIVNFAGMFSLVVSVVCVVLGILKLRRKDVKKAVLFALVGVAYSVVILGGIYLDEAVHTMQYERDLANRNEQTYGENWDAPPAIEGIPELYQEELNKFYAAVRNEWSADQLVDLNAEEMANYYGDASLDHIGFLLMDVNGDGVEELMIGTTAPVEEGGTAIFCMYSDPENPFVTLYGEAEMIYHLHPGENGTHVAEIGGTYVAENGSTDGVWLLEVEEGASIVNSTYQEKPMDPAGRLTLEMIPFSQYK